VRINGDEFDAEAITDAVAELDPEPGDSVVFQYAGHGARGESKTDPWPVLALGTHSDSGAHEALDIASIYSGLHKKSPRMLMILADCCNEILPDHMLSEVVAKSERSDRSAHEIANLKAMFVDFSGEVLGIGSKPGTYAYGVNGGVFTTQTLTAIELAVGQPTPRKWTQVMNEAARSMNVLASLGVEAQQTPVWRVVDQLSRRSLDQPAPGLRAIEDGWVVGSLADEQPSTPNAPTNEREQRQQDRLTAREERDAQRQTEREDSAAQRQSEREERERLRQERRNR
jgi:hypothetical protein